MFRPAEFFKAIPRLLAAVVLAVAGVVALLVAWWIAIAIVLGFAVYLAVRRILPRQPGGPGGGADIIEGEYRVERDEPPRPPHLENR